MLFFAFSNGNPLIVNISPVSSTPQPIIVNLRIDTDTRQSALSRNIDDTLDYATLANEVIEMAVGEEHLLIETLVQVIADHCLGHPLVLGVLVKVEKPQAVQSADSVGVQIYRQKDSAT